MHYLIKFIGKIIARQIERGSVGGAWVGGLIGLALAVAAAFVLSRMVELDEYRFAMYIIMGVPLAIVGALCGARLGPRGHS